MNTKSKLYRLLLSESIKIVSKQKMLEEQKEIKNEGNSKKNPIDR